MRVRLRTSIRPRPTALRETGRARLRPLSSEQPAASRLPSPDIPTPGEDLRWVEVPRFLKCTGTDHSKLSTPQAPSLVTLSRKPDSLCKHGVNLLCVPTVALGARGARSRAARAALLHSARRSSATLFDYKPSRFVFVYLSCGSVYIGLCWSENESGCHYRPVP